MLVSSRVIKRGWEIVELAMKVSSWEYGEYGVGNFQHGTFDSQRVYERLYYGVGVYIAQYPAIGWLKSKNPPK